MTAFVFRKEMWVICDFLFIIEMFKWFDCKMIIVLYMVLMMIMLFCEWLRIIWNWFCICKSSVECWMWKMHQCITRFSEPFLGMFNLMFEFVFIRSPTWNNFTFRTEPIFVDFFISFHFLAKRWYKNVSWWVKTLEE